MNEIEAKRERARAAVRIECSTCGGRGAVTLVHGLDDYEDVPCPDCPEPRHALAVFAVEQDPEAVIAELVRAGVLVQRGRYNATSGWHNESPGCDIAPVCQTFYGRALPDEVQTDG